jgi:hypothetical protein
MALPAKSSDLRASLQRAKSALSNIRESAQRGVRRAMVPAVSAPTAYGVGRLHGWATRTGKDVNIPNTDTPYTLVAGVVLAAAGAFGEKLLGENVADLSLGLGAGAVDANLALIGHEHGMTPPKK